MFPFLPHLQCYSADWFYYYFTEQGFHFHVSFPFYVQHCSSDATLNLGPGLQLFSCQLSQLTLLTLVIFSCYFYDDNF